MPLKSRKPITPGQRGLILQTTDDITSSKPKKSLLKPIKNEFILKCLSLYII